MARLSDLRIAVTKASPTEDHSTYKYHIRVDTSAAGWEVTKRFSDFDALLQSLGASRYAGLPKLPAKTLLGSPTEQATIDARKEQLRIILQDLILRPDTRNSQQLWQFLNAGSYIAGDPRPLQPEAVRTFEDPRFGVSGLQAAPEANLLFMTHEDSTHLSRLGRVWSVVEPDELGALHIWTQSGDEPWTRTFSHTFGIKARSLCWEDASRQVFVGLEDGKIEIYALPSDANQPNAKATLDLHHKSPVTHLSVSSRKLLSLGLDTAMRVIDVKTRELLCGGRLQKRLKGEMDYLSSGYLDDDQDRAFIGTSGGDLFILDISRNPPNFLHTLELPSSPVTAMCLFKEMLLVAHCDCVTAFSLKPRSCEQNIVPASVYRSKHLHFEEAGILSVATADERDLIFGGFSDGSVAVWLSRESEAVLVFRAHSCDTTQLAWLQYFPWGPALLTGGGDGKITSWTLIGEAEDYVLCTSSTYVPDDLFGRGLTGNSGDAAFESPLAFGGSSDLFRMEAPRVNPQALKQEGESDDDDDIADAFR